jgi:hypothetical protein
MKLFNRKQNDAPATLPPVIVAQDPPPASIPFTPNYQSGLTYLTDGHLARRIQDALVSDILLVIYDNAILGRKRNNQYIGEQFYDRGLGDAYILAINAAFTSAWNPEGKPVMDREHFQTLIAGIQSGIVRFVANAFDDDLPDYFVEDCKTFDRWTLAEWGTLR